MSESDNSFAAFATQVNKLNPDIMPDGDAEDARNGANNIPSKVTSARQRGEKIKFVQGDDRSKWHWEMPDGSKIPYKDV